MADPTVVASGFIGSPGGETTNASSRSLTLPTVEDGDWLLTGPTLAGGSTTVLATSAALSWASEAAAAIATRSGYATHGFAKQLAAANSGAVISFATSTSIKVATPWVIIRGLKPGQTPVWRTPVTGLAANPMTPPAFTAAPGKVLVHFIGIATGASAPPSVGSWTTPVGITMIQAATMGGTTGRAGAAIGAQLTENVGISGDWDSDASSSWGIIAVELEIAEDDPVPVPATVHVGASSFPWEDEAAADTLYSPAPTLSTTTGSSSTIAGATLIAANDARFRYRGGAGFAFGSGTPDSSCYQPSSRYPNGWGNPATFAVSFLHTGTEFELLYKWLSATGAGWFRISVDGQRFTDLMYDIPGTSGGSMTKTKVTFGSSATRHILVEVQGVPFAGVFVGAGNTIAQAPPFSRRIIVQGDSTSAGSDGNTGGGAGTWVARFARYAGENVDVWNQAIGGTGFTEPGTAVTIPNRLADVTSYAPDDVILWCGGNDGSTSIVTEATDWIADVKAAVPDVRVIVVGTWSPTVTASAARAARSADLKAAAAANDCPFIEPITGEVYDADGTLVASQGPWIADAGDVTAYVYSGDNVHPNDAGHAYIAQRMVQAMQAITGPIEATGTAQAPTVSAGASLTAPTSSVTAAAVAPTVTAAALVAPPTATVTATAVAPTVGAGPTVQAPTVTVTAAAVAPSVHGAVTVTSPTSTATAAAYPPTVSAADAATVAAPTATLTAAALVPVIQGAVLLEAPTRDVVTSVIPPSVSAGEAVDVLAPTIAVVVTAHPPTAGVPSTTVRFPVMQDGVLVWVTGQIRKD